MRKLGRSAPLLIAALVAALAASGAQAQRESVTVSFGYDNQIVTGRWNPLRVVARDLPSAELIVSFDQGGAQLGAITGEYRATIAGGAGVSIFEDDIFIPPVRALSWQLVTSERVLASGSFDRRALDSEAVHLLLSAVPGRYLGIYGVKRVVDVGAGDLVARLPAYDGVVSLLIDGSAAPPSLEAVSAAAAAGVTVLLLEPPPSHAELLELAESYPKLGAGGLRVVSAGELSSALAAAAVAEWRAAVAAFGAQTLVDDPAALPPGPLFVAAASYLLLVLVLVRFGGVPGILSSLLLGGFAALLAASYLPRGAAQLEATRVLELSGGPLARVEQLDELVSLPARELVRAGAAAPQQALPYRQTADGLRFGAARWSRTRWLARPQLALASVTWQGGVLVNRHAEPLVDVYIIGLGAQPELHPGRQLQPQAGEGAVPERYRELVAYLPAGTALASAGTTIFAALPEGR